MKSDRISSIFFLAFSLFILEESYRLELGTFRFPKAGFLPFWSGLALGVLSLILFISTLFHKANADKKEEAFELNRQRVPKILFVALSIALFGVLLNTLGFVVCCLLFVGVLVRTVEPQKWLVVVSTAVSVSLASYVLFVVWLKMQVPSGIFGF